MNPFHHLSQRSLNNMCFLCQLEKNSASFSFFLFCFFLQGINDMGTSHDNCTVLGNNFVVICHDMPYNYCFEGSNWKSIPVWNQHFLLFLKNYTTSFEINIATSFKNQNCVLFILLSKISA